MKRTDYTFKKRKWLLALRRKPRTWDYLQKKAKVDDETMNIMLSDIGNLYYVKGNAPILTGEITLNHIGETVAQAEFDY